MRLNQHRWHPELGWKSTSTAELTPQLVLIFGSPQALQHQAALKWLRDTYPTAHLCGCSTAGEIYQTQVMDNSLVATVVQFDHTQIHGFAVQLLPNEPSFEAGDRLGQQINTVGLTHVFLLSDGLQVNGSELVRGLLPHLPAGVTVTGGLAGDGDRFEQTCVLWQDTPQAGQIVALGLYSDRLQVGFGSLGGWQPFGPERLITKSNGNVLYELDGEPALALYKKYLGEHANQLPASGLLFPLSLRVDTTDRHLVRTILAVNEADQSLTFAGDVPTGTIAQLMQASFDRLVDGAMQAAATSLRPLAGAAPDLAILISCVGRKLLLKQRIEEEVEGVQAILGDRTVLTGFYSYGEISPFAPGASCELHNQTMTITTLRET
ncbi:MAG: FIST N-terminal domain-containing protein [Leptolyngbyaceae cyanobacterium bins.349]|nr:FIST N-terminal domain-containing protein [Leptolyngbyaceae cyanobacterium bins.349]